ncbi:hypothetical protein TorRG33x02_034790 [Trema orientale]|uniref:Uncharacterized protein n=1 Tax=Trema orientale TaxID=63057 RepID=A0A2P5FSR1_TREOI|nr:hypothetical protein TorRG33x02_034790 [Trema orientale]
MKVKQKFGYAINLLYSCGCATSEAYPRLVLECVRPKDFAQAKGMQSRMELSLFHLTIEDLKKVFDQMPDRDLVSFDTIIVGPSRNGHPRKAL